MTQTISIDLGSAIIYVTGTVNGIAATFTLSGSVWQSVVDKTDDGIYEIEITGLDAAGNSTVYTTTLYYGFHVVTSRNANSYYNPNDLNRVGASVQYLADLLNSYGYKVTVNTKTDWTQISIPFDDLMTTYLANVQALVDVYCTMPNTPSLPSVMQNLTWQSANSIEQNLADINTLLGYMIAQFSFSNTIYSGE